MRPMLRPGLQILRRDLRTLQLGFEWAGVGTMVETPALRAVLAAVDGFRDAEGVLQAATSSNAASTDAAKTDQVSTDEAAAALGALIDCGVLVDQSTTGAGELDDEHWAALWLLAGPGHTAGEVLAKRRGCRVHVSGDGLLARRVRSLLDGSGIMVTTAATDATLLVLADHREPDRAEADRAMHSGLPHLWAWVRDLVGIVGPFVVPGQTACLRCADAARAELDPSWPTLVQASTARRPGPAACDPLLASLIAAWAAQEVTLWAGDLRPQTTGAQVEVPYGGGPVQRQMLEPHPKCGCGWPLWHDTMGA